MSDARHDVEPSALLSVVSAAAARMARDPRDVPTIAVGAAVDLGHAAGVLRVLDEDSLEHRVLESLGLDEDPDDPRSLSAEMTDLVLRNGAIVVARRDPGHGEAPLPDRATDVVAAVASPPRASRPSGSWRRTRASASRTPSGSRRAGGRRTGSSRVTGSSRGS